LKKNKKRNITLAAIVVVVIALVIGFNYSAEQTRIKGFIFGNELQQIQEDLKKLQDEFEANLSMYKDGDISKEEFLDFAPNHVRKMEELISRYDRLEPPPTFVSSTEVLKYSTELQLESQEHLISWVKSGNEDDLFLANRTHQESFNMEMIGLGDFEKALAGNMP